MSTKTTFKRIALVAVAALGLGVLSVAPSSATTSGLTITASGTATAGNTAGTVADTTTAAMFTINALTTDSSDTISVSMIRKSAPSAGSGIKANLGFVDTSTVSTAVGSLITSIDGMNFATVFDSKTAVSTGASDGYTISGGVGYKTARFSILLDTATAPAAGSYVYTVIASSYKGLGAFDAQTLGDVTITVAALASASKSVDPSKSSALLSGGATFATATVDSAVSTLATASATVKGVIRVINNNASNAAVAESITVTVTGPGVVRKSGDSSAGKSIKVIGDGNDDIEILSDGTAGTSSIVVATTSVTYAAKTVTFFAPSAATFTLSANKPVIGVSATAVADTVRAVILDSNSLVWGGQAYIVAATAADALIAGSSTPVACTFDAANGRHGCPVAGTAKGTANFTVIDAATVATAVGKSAATQAIRVSTGVATTAKITFDKANYQPGEKATILFTPLDAEGLALPSGTVTAAFTAAPTVNVAFSGTAPTFSADIVIAAASSSSSATTAGSVQYTAYMPLYAGDITISATGGNGLAPAGRVAVTATASVSNNSADAAADAANEATDAANAATDAALAAADAADAATAAAEDASAAVAALAASVNTALDNLKKQISALTALVNKLLKKK